MDEHRTAAAPYAWPRIMVDFDDEIVQMIGAAQPIAWFTGRPLHSVVITAVSWVFAPGVSRADAAKRQQGSGPQQTVSSPPQP